MTWRPEKSWLCEECATIIPDSQLLVATHPFDAAEKIYGCPECKGVAFVRACDRSDCDREASCGTPTPDGYRNTCSAHWPKGST